MPVLTLHLFLSGNADGDCYPQEEPLLLQVKLPGFQSYSSFSFVLLAIMIGLCFFFALASYSLDLMKTSQPFQHAQTSLRNIKQFSSRLFLWQFEVDEKYALKHLGEGSVYSFFISRSVTGWCIALAIVAAQFWMVGTAPFYAICQYVK